MCDRGHPGRPSSLVDEGQVLDLLTPVQRSATDELMPLPALFVHGFDHTAIVMVTGPNGPSSRVAAIAQMATVRIGTDAQPGTGIALAAVDAVDFVNRWRAWA